MVSNKKKVQILFSFSESLEIKVLNKNNNFLCKQIID